MPNENLQTVELLKALKAKEVDFTNEFGEDLNGFKDALGISRVIPVQEGFTLKMYGKPKVTLADGNVAEGELIPLSKVEPTVHSTKEIKLKKYRKVTTAEAIGQYGPSKAIDQTDEALIKEIQKSIRDDLFSAVQNGNAQENLNEEGGLQGALATSWGALQTVFEDDTIRTVVFAHPLDVASEIANRKLSLETRFGLNYYTDATGTMVFTSTQVARGHVYATAPSNLVIAYVPANSDIGESFALTSDSSGFIGMAHSPALNSFTHETVAASGVLIFPERVDGVIKVPLAAAAPAGE